MNSHRIPDVLERAIAVALRPPDPFLMLVAAVVGALVDEYRSRPTPLEIARWHDDGGMVRNGA